MFSDEMELAPVDTISLGAEIKMNITKRAAAAAAEEAAADDSMQSSSAEIKANVTKRAAAAEEAAPVDGMQSLSDEIIANVHKRAAVVEEAAPEAAAAADETPTVPAVPALTKIAIDGDPERAATVIQAQFRGHHERKVPRADRKFAVLGVTGSGKAGQCKRLAAQLGTELISAGQLLRQEIEAGSEIGKKVDWFLEEKKAVPDEIISQLMLGKLQTKECTKNGWILEGFPRNTAQAKALTAAGLAPTQIVTLQVPTPQVVVGSENEQQQIELRTQIEVRCSHTHIHSIFITPNSTNNLQC